MGGRRGNPSLRTRRWDAVVLGTSLPGLIAAIVLGRRGARVLVLEERGAERFPGLREPFLLTGAGPDGVLGACLRDLALPLIERKRLEPLPTSFQVVLPDARFDVGEPDWTSQELANWGFAEQRSAKNLLAALGSAGEAEREAMLAAPILRPPRLRSLGGRRSPPPSMTRMGATRVASETPRGMPDESKDLPDGLAALLHAQIRALSNCGTATPGSREQARLLGAALCDGAVLSRGEPWLRSLLRRRIETLFGEFRSLRDGFHLTTVNNQPAISVDEDHEILAGRSLILNAPRAALAAVVDQNPLPDWLRGPAVTHRRHSLHFKIDSTLVPDAMADRVICIQDLERPMEGTNVVTLRAFRLTDGDRATVDLVASAVLPTGETDLAARDAEIEAQIAGLFPFANGGLKRQEDAPPRWDDDTWLADPPRNGAWPQESEIRISSKPRVFALERSNLAGLGFEGDVLLGWRAGDAIATELD
jgi:hypothetical protein